MVKYIKAPARPVKTAGQSLLDTLMLTALSLFIYYAIEGVFKVLFWPFRFLSMTDDQVYDEEKAQAKRKIRERETMLKDWREDPSNPMGDPRYEGWFKLWREGKAIDSRLEWAPDVYVRDAVAGRSFNPAFLGYLEIQVGLHEKAGWANRALLKNTLWKYYPEFSPNIGAVRAEIAAIRERVEAKTLARGLDDELGKMGISKMVVRKLMAEKLGPEDLQRHIAGIKACVEQGYCEGAAVTIDELGIDAKSKEAQGINKLISEAGVPGYIPVAFVKGEIDRKSYDFLVRIYQDRVAREGDSAETQRLMLTMFREEQRASAPRVRKATMVQEHGKPVWEA